MPSANAATSVFRNVAERPTGVRGPIGAAAYDSIPTTDAARDHAAKQTWPPGLHTAICKISNVPSATQKISFSTLTQPDNPLRDTIRTRAQTLRKAQADRSHPGQTGNEATDDLEIVLIDLLNRLLAESEVNLEPAMVPPSRAAYVAGFALFLTTTLRTQLKLSETDPKNDLGLKIATRLFDAFDPPQRQKLFSRGLTAIEQMLQILGQAGHLQHWMTELHGNLDQAITDGRENSVTGLVRQFSSLPLVVRDLQFER